MSKTKAVEVKIQAVLPPLSDPSSAKANVGINNSTRVNTNESVLNIF
jgi:hypothetical protein